MKAGKLSRRQVLRGAGVALSLPLLELFERPARAAPAPAPRRYIALHFPNGTASYWRPTGAGSRWTLSPLLEPLGPNKAKVSVLGNIANYSPWGVHPASSHASNMAAAWTGVRANGPNNTQSAISVDQVVANQLAADNGGVPPTAIHSLQVGLSTLNAETEALPAAHSRSISWAAPDWPLYKLVSPQGVFDRLVGGGGAASSVGANAAPDAAAERRRLLKKSALDYVTGETADLQRRLGASDRATLDRFLTSVRGLETRVGRTDMPGQPVGGTCAALGRPTQTFGVGSVPEGYDRGVHASLMIDLVVMAIQCDLTRVVSFMLDDARSNFAYDFLTMRAFTQSGSTLGTGRGPNYHSAQHAGDTDDGFATIGYWNVARANELATKLDAIREGDGTVLDNTVITFLSGMNGGNHDAANLPIALIGGGGGVLKTNQFFAFPTLRNLQDVHLTILRHVFGSPLATFGQPVAGYTSATMPELLA